MSELVNIFEATKLTEAPEGKLQDKKVDEIKELVDEDPAITEVRNLVSNKEQDPNAQDPMTDPMAADPNANPGDADYLMDNTMMDPGLMGMEQVMELPERVKKLKLFELYRELINYTVVFEESLDVIDMNLLDSAKSRELKEYRTRLDALIEKLKSYVKLNYIEEQYEKSLYVYVLMRTELLTIIKLLREMLVLNKNSKKAEDENPKTKNSNPQEEDDSETEE